MDGITALILWMGMLVAFAIAVEVSDWWKARQSYNPPSTCTLVKGLKVEDGIHQIASDEAWFYWVDGPDPINFDGPFEFLADARDYRDYHRGSRALTRQGDVLLGTREDAHWVIVEGEWSDTDLAGPFTEEDVDEFWDSQEASA